MQDLPWWITSLNVTKISLISPELDKEKKMDLQSIKRNFWPNKLYRTRAQEVETSYWISCVCLLHYFWMERGTCDFKSEFWDLKRFGSFCVPRRNNILILKMVFVIISLWSSELGNTSFQFSQWMTFRIFTTFFLFLSYGTNQPTNHTNYQTRYNLLPKQRSRRLTELESNTSNTVKARTLNTTDKRMAVLLETT